MIISISDNLTPSKGRVLLDGRGIDELGSEYRKLLGYMPQQQNIYPELSLRRFLYFMASLKGLKKSEAGKDIEHYVRMVKLDDVLGKKLGAFSGGMKQRALIAQALIGNPGILILDEPTAGLDPKGENQNPQSDIRGCKGQDCYYCDSCGYGCRVYRQRDSYVKQR